MCDHFGFSGLITKKVDIFSQKVPWLVHSLFYCACTDIDSICLKLLIYGVNGLLKVAPTVLWLQKIVFFVQKAYLRVNNVTHELKKYYIDWNCGSISHSLQNENWVKKEN